MAEKKNIYTLYEDKKNGCVQISDDVMAVIAAMAATDVEGVAALKGNISASQVSKAGSKKIAKSTKLQVGEDGIHVQIIIRVRYGYNLTDVCRQIQDKIKDNLENMTGMEVKKVDVSIEDVDIQKEKRSAKEKKKID